MFVQMSLFDSIMGWESHPKFYFLAVCERLNSGGPRSALPLRPHFLSSDSPARVALSHHSRLSEAAGLTPTVCCSTGALGRPGLVLGSLAARPCSAALLSVSGVSLGRWTDPAVGPSSHRLCLLKSSSALSWPAVREGECARGQPL